MTPTTPYVHGYDRREGFRLRDQASILAGFLHSDTTFPRGSLVLEAGCGVGAQTLTLARMNPDARFVCIDVSRESLMQARDAARETGLLNTEFQQADVGDLPFAPASFDHVFVCFLLEHLSKPQAALSALGRLLRPGGTITVIEGDHGSAYFYPDSAAAHDAIRCLVQLQRDNGGDPMIGRQLYPLLKSAGFVDVGVSPRMIYVDGSKEHLVDGFTRKTFTAMIEGAREGALAARLIDSAVFDQGIRDLYATSAADGVFCYTFFKGTARAL